jgi:methyltransferase (TIGR00027 family)
MQTDRPSMTSLAMAYLRAYHATENPHQTVFLDPIAPKLLTPEEVAQFEDLKLKGAAYFAPEAAAACADRQALLALAMRVVPPRGLPLARGRFVEDRVLAAVQQGTTQVVNIGAGLDTFAQRHPELLATVAVYELDHPATQDDKRRRLAAAGLEEPAGLCFVPVDLSRTSLDQALAGTAYDPTRATFFIWAGVTYYLPKPAVLATFTAMRRCSGPGSQVAFDYLEAAALGPDAAPEILKSRAMLEKIGEPFLTGFEPSELALAEDLGPEQIEERYFRPTMPGYRATPHFRFALAQWKADAR